ncbi:MAG: hypothetical protein DRQ62_14700 [Gammaproteobacteria bacterium]|nr:MAG: hypothetical protein DRQ62_14700 [Gammaproteobacteria bacterium]
MSKTSHPGNNNSQHSFNAHIPGLDSIIEYEHQIRQSSSRQNPIIVIPGILGSNIVTLENKKTLWGDFGKSLADPKADKNLRMIALPMERGKTLDQLQGESAIDGSLRYIKGSIAGVPISINTYASMLSAMGVGERSGAGSSLNKLDDYIDDRRHEANAFEFSYDWRRSLDENAIRLAEYIRQVTRFVQLQRGSYEPVKFDIVAHSMGGLIARYYLQYGEQLLPAGDAMPIANWSGSAQIEKVVLISPPNGGALPGLDCLLVGIPKNPITPKYDPVILGTLPAVYQLFPRLRYKMFKRSDADEQHSNFMNLDLWLEMNWGLADPTKDWLLARLLPGVDSPSARRETALDHLDKCLTSSHKLQLALDKVTTRPEHLKMFLFVGDAINTPLVATAKKGDKKLTYIRKGAGDGTVPRSCALLDERVGGKWSSKVQSPLQWDNVMFLQSNHLGMTKDPLCIKNILYILFERP